MRDLVIYGAGGFGREVRLMIDQINADRQQWNVIGFVDDGKEAGTQVDDLEVLGGGAYLQQAGHRISVVLALADGSQRKLIEEKLRNAPLDFPVLIHPEADTGDRKRNKFEAGTIITAGNILTTAITLGRFVMVNLACTIGHDVRLQDFCSVMPGCHISGNVSVGGGTFVGTGARILQNLTIGAQCKIGAGAVVTKNFGDQVTIVGVPAEEKKHERI